MASAVMSSRNEPYWGENKTHMRNTYTESNTHRFDYSSTTVNPNPNSGNAVPNHGSNRRNQDDVYVTSNSRRREGNERRLDDAVAAVTAVSDLRGGAGGVNDCTELLSAEIGYWTFDRSDYTRDELKELKKKFLVDLEQVRTLRRRIDLGRFRSESRHSGGAAPKVAIDCDTEEDKVLPMMNQNRNNPQMDVLNASTNPKQHYKKKRLSGPKQSNVSAGKNPEAKRLKLDPAVDKLINNMKKRCGEILGELMRHKHGWIFNKPVNAVKMGLHDYHQIIKNPMDLGTVKSKLRKGVYATPLDFAADVNLTFNNAILYNPEGQDAHVMAKLLLSDFNVMFSPMKKRFEDDCRLMKAAEEAQHLYQQQSLPLNSPPVAENVRPRVPVPTENKSPPCRGQVTPLSPTRARPSTPLNADAVKPVMIQEKWPRPKARDRNKRTMSYEEKVELSIELQNLPEDDMVQLLNIVKSRTGHLNQDGDEIELDIESMDNEMLWELDRFVSNAQKMASRMMRQQQEHGIISNQTAEPEINNKLDHHRDLPAYKQQESAGEEDVDIGEEILTSQYPPVEIERDNHDANQNCRSNSSASTSSSSGSSSSGSGSASSSGSESEDVDTLQSPYIEFIDAPVAAMMA